jgi:hypothetical protein
MHGWDNGDELFLNSGGAPAAFLLAFAHVHDPFSNAMLSTHEQTIDLM